MGGDDLVPPADMVKIEATIYPEQYRWLEAQLKDARWTSFDRLIIASIGTFRALQSTSSGRTIGIARFALSGYSLMISTISIMLSIIVIADLWSPVLYLHKLTGYLSVVCQCICILSIIYYSVSITALYAINEIYRYRFFKISNARAVALHAFSLFLPMMLFVAVLAFLKQEKVSVIDNYTALNYWLLPLDLAVKGLLFDALSYLNLEFERAAVDPSKQYFLVFCFVYKLYYNYLGASAIIFFINTFFRERISNLMKDKAH